MPGHGSSVYGAHWDRTHPGWVGARIDDDEKLFFVRFKNEDEKMQKTKTDFEKCVFLTPFFVKPVLATPLI